VVIGPSIIRKSTLIEQVRQTAADAANFVELTCSDELRLSHEAQPVIVYVDPADRCADEQLKALVAQAATRISTSSLPSSTICRSPLTMR